MVSLAVVGWRRVFPPSHQHCILQASMLLKLYAAENGGKFPLSERGWGDGLLKLGAKDPPESWIRLIVGVDDDGAVFEAALADGTDIDEAACSRVYVQGLDVESDGDVAILFDRYSEPGGDHQRCRFRAPVREVLTVGGRFTTVRDDEWPGFVEKQRGLLREQGFGEQAIAEVYGEWP